MVSEALADWRFYKEAERYWYEFDDESWLLFYEEVVGSRLENDILRLRLG